MSNRKNIPWMENRFSFFQEKIFKYFSRTKWWLAFYMFEKPEELEKKLLNFAHHYEFEQSGLNLNDIKKMISENKAVYDYGADMKKNKWSGKI